MTEAEVRDLLEQEARKYSSSAMCLSTKRTATSYITRIVTFVIITNVNNEVMLDALIELFSDNENINFVGSEMNLQQSVELD